MRASIAVCVVASVLTAGCGHHVSVPQLVRGVWGSDCKTPFVSFNEDSIHIYADNASYALKEVTFNGNDLHVKYENTTGAVVETYVKSGETLRIKSGTYNGVDTSWDKPPMSRCPSN